MASRATFYLPGDLRERLQVRAGVLERSESWCVARAVEAWLEVPPSPEGADRALGDRPGAPRAAQPPVTPRASVPPLLNRVTSLGTPSKPIPRKTR